MEFCEPLERRTLLSVSLIGAPSWVEQGPGPISNIGFGVQQQSTGAVNGIAADPFDANLMFVSTVNGGIWRTTNSTAGSPDWTTTTDQLPSLSMGAIAISPLDSSGAVRTAATPLSQTVVYAGHLRNSSGGGDGGPLAGVVKSTDGGNTWIELGQLVGRNIFFIIPTTQVTGTGQVVLAGTGNGLFRSADGGASWTQISGSSGAADSLDNDADGTVDEFGEINLPGGNICDLDADPGTANSFYASIPGQGVFRSTNGGQNWVVVNSNMATLGSPYGAGSPALVAGSSFVQVAVHNTAGNNVVYATIVPGAPPVTNPVTPQAFPQVFRSTNQGGTWTAMDNFPETFIGQNVQSGMVADPADPNIVFMAGLQGAAPGDIFRGDFGAGAGTQWQRDDGPAANNTSPHPDIRDLAFDRNGNLISSNDGGIYRLVDPNTPGATRRWFAMAGDMAPVEFYSTAYDALNNTIFGGTQDNGTPRQRKANAPADPLYPADWPEARGADGGIVAVDNDQVAHPGTTIIYTETQYLNLDRRIINNVNNQTVAAGVGQGVNGTGGRALGGAGTFPNPRPGAYPGGPLVFDNTIQFIQPFVLNAVRPNQVLIGTTFLYESLDVATGNNFTSLGGLVDLTNDGVDDDNDGNFGPDPDEFRPNGSLGTISALAYGGRLGGVDAPDVIFAGSSGGTGNGQLPNGRLFRRTTNSTNTLADFTTLTNYPGGTPRDIVLDPDNWQRGYVVDNNGQVFRFLNGGTSAGDWTNITGGAANPGRLGNLTTDLRSIELFTPTSAPGDDVLLVGGLGGVFRTLDPQDGANALWTEFGTDMPNVLAKDVRYDPITQTLLAGTYGRGAFTIPNADASLLIPGGILQIDGDTDFAGQDDVITLLRNAANPSILDVYLNSAVPTFSVALSIVQQINVNGLGGKDQLFVDSSNGLISVAAGIRYDGGAQSDVLTLQQTGSVGPAIVGDLYSVGPDIGQGTSLISSATATQNVQFDNLEPVFDLVPAPTLAVTATPENNAISYTIGSALGNGKLAIDNYESIEFSNKARLSVDASFGNDVVNLNNSATPTALTEVIVLAGDGDDVVTTNSTISVALEVQGGAGNDRLDAAGAPFGADLNGGDGNDTLVSAGGNDTLTGGAGEDLLSAGGGTNTVNGNGGADTLLVSGTNAADTIDIDHSAAGTLAVTVNAAVASNSVSGLEIVRVEAAAGSDDITINPFASGGLSYTVLGGDPIGAVGDRLNIDTGGPSAEFTPGPENDAGAVVVATATPTNISFDEIEALSITGGPAVISGTNGPDAITVIARDASTHAGANGVQDFTVSVNASPAFLFLNTANLTVNALAGDDDIDLQATAPNNAAWNVNVTIDGGPPGASDTLVVETPGAGGSETVGYFASGPNSGTMTILEGGAPPATAVNIIDVENLVYDGRGDNDSIVYHGTAGDDSITIDSGPANDAGRVRTDSLLAFAYQNLGASPDFSVQGDGGADTASFNGTAGGDSFLVNRLAANIGGVTVNAHFQLSTSDIQTLICNGLGGDDVFNLTPALSAMPYGSVYFVGGENSLVGGDRAIVNGTAGDDSFNLQGNTLVLGGKLVSYNGVENTDLDAKDGVDTIHILSRDGTTEAFNIAASPIANAGRIYVTGQFNVNFTSANFFDVAGSALDTDTLSLFGTNDLDNVQIHAEAVGTAAAPVLKLQNGSLATLLTLTNYTGIQTLKVFTLDGADVVNVFTGPAIGRSLFIDASIPTAKKKLTDKLNIFYVFPKPRIVQSTATQLPRSGLVDLDYGTSRTLVQYSDTEDIVIRRV